MDDVNNANRFYLKRKREKKQRTALKTKDGNGVEKKHIFGLLFGIKLGCLKYFGIVCIPRTVF